MKPTRATLRTEGPHRSYPLAWMRGESADGTADSIVTRGPSGRPSQTQIRMLSLGLPSSWFCPGLPVSTSAPAPPVNVSLPAPLSPAKWMASADRLEAATTSSPSRALTVGRSKPGLAQVLLTWAVSPRTEAPNASPATRMDSLPLVPLTMTAFAWKSDPLVRNMESLSASPVDLLGEGLGAGVEVGVAAVDRPDGEQARDREKAPDARLAVDIERDSRHRRVAHEERDGARGRAGPRGGADRGRERDHLPHDDRVGGRQQGQCRHLADGGRVHLLGEGLRASQEGRGTAVERGDGVAARGREAGRQLRRAAGPDRDGPQDHAAVLERDGAGRRAGPRGHRGYPGREGHRLASDGRVDRRPEGERGRGGVDGHGHGRRIGGGEAGDAEAGG